MRTTVLCFSAAALTVLLLPKPADACSPAEPPQVLDIVPNTSDTAAPELIDAAA